jgi:hypothetical protein
MFNHDLDNGQTTLTKYSRKHPMFSTKRHCDESIGVRAQKAEEDSMKMLIFPQVGLWPILP